MFKFRYQHISITNQTSMCVTTWSCIGLYSCTDEQLEHNSEYFDETSLPKMLSDCSWVKEQFEKSLFRVKFSYIH